MRGQDHFRGGSLAAGTRGLCKLSTQAQLRIGDDRQDSLAEFSACRAALPSLRHLRWLQHAASRSGGTGSSQTEGSGGCLLAYRAHAARSGLSGHIRTLLGISLACPAIGSTGPKKGWRSGGIPRKTQQLHRRHGQLRGIAAQGFRIVALVAPSGRLAVDTGSPAANRGGRRRFGHGAGPAHPAGADARRRRPAACLCR